MIWKLLLKMLGDGAQQSEMQRLSLSSNIEEIISNYVKDEINSNQNRKSLLSGDERLTEMRTNENAEPIKNITPLSPCQPCITEFVVNINKKIVEEIAPETMVAK